jgi:Gpi18-like mannosyltransferase
MNLNFDNINQRVSEVSLVLIIALLSRITVLVSSAIGFAFFSGSTIQHFVFPNSYLDIFGTFDGGWYKSIALFGYPVINHMPSGNWAFFPLYPFLMNIGGAFLFGTIKIPLTTATTLAGFIVSNALFFVCVILFYRLSKLLINNKKTVLISVAFFSFWGSSFFYSAVYSESLFMTLSLSAFYLLEKGQTTKSTIFGFFAGLARSSGFIVSVPFIYNGLQTRKYRRAVLQSFVIFLPYILFNIYGYIATGTFPVREMAQKLYWTPTINYPITIGFLSKNMGLLIFFAVEAIIISVPIIYYLFKERIPIADFAFGLDKRRDLKYWALTLVAVVMLVFVVIYAQANSIQRYAIIILPMYWVSAFTWRKNPKLGKTLLILWITILIIGTIIFASREPFIL